MTDKTYRMVFESDQCPLIGHWYTDAVGDLYVYIGPGRLSKDPWIQLNSSSVYPRADGWPEEPLKPVLPDDLYELIKEIRNA